MKILLKSALRVGLLALVGWQLDSASVSAGTWTSISPPGNIGLSLLLGDGSVLAQKGPGTSNWFRLYPDSAGHYANKNNWSSSVPAMADNRQFFSSDILPSGLVFVAGGEYGTTGAGNRAAIYNPYVNTWTPISVPSTVLAPGFTASDGLNAGFRDSPSIVLNDGRVLVVPIFPATNNVAAIYDPNANSWSTTPPTINFLNEAGLNKLPDGTILALDKNSTTTERYVPSQNTWIADASTPVVMYSTNAEVGASLQLPDGRVLYFGGTGATVYYTPSGNLNPGTWAQGPAIPGGLVARDAPAALLPNGDVLCAFSPTTNDRPISFFQFTPATGVYAPQTAPNGNSTYTYDISDQCAMLVLPDGNVLFSDAYASTAYIYQPASTTPQQSWKPVIYGFSFNQDGSIHVYGTQFNGLSQGGTFGDDDQMDSNYPLVKFTDGSGNVYFGTSYNWSSTGVQTGGQLVSTECALPGQVYNNPGAYSMQVVANGISSDAVGFPGPIWVDFNFVGNPKIGTYYNPFNTLAQGVNSVATGAEIYVKPGLSHETMTISKAMTITAIGGIAVIGQ